MQIASDVHLQQRFIQFQWNIQSLDSNAAQTLEEIKRGSRSSLQFLSTWKLIKQLANFLIFQIHPNKGK